MTSETEEKHRYGSCACGQSLRAGWAQCKTCTKVTRLTTRVPAAVPSVLDFDVTDLITSLGLDYCTGNAARFLLECHDGDVLENLRTARTYLDKAIFCSAKTASTLLPFIKLSSISAR